MTLRIEKQGYASELIPGVFPTDLPDIFTLKVDGPQPSTSPATQTADEEPQQDKLRLTPGDKGQERWLPVETVELPDNSVLNFRKSEVKHFKDAPKDDFIMGWDNDMGGAIMLNPLAKGVHFMGLPEAKSLDDALRLMLSSDMLQLLQTSRERGMAAARGRFAAVWDESHQMLHLIEIVEATGAKGHLRYVNMAKEQWSHEMRSAGGDTDVASGEADGRGQRATQPATPTGARSTTKPEGE